jgi:plasmid stability protein
MANLQIKNMDDDFYKKIKALADAENRSVSQQVIFLVKDYLLKRQNISKIKSPAPGMRTSKQMKSSRESKANEPILKNWSMDFKCICWIPTSSFII